MTTVRLSKGQKRKLEEALAIRAKRSGRNLSRGEAIERLAEFALDRKEDWAQESQREEPTWEGHTLFDPNIGWDMGYTDEKTVDQLLYGRR